MKTISKFVKLNWLGILLALILLCKYQAMSTMWIEILLILIVADFVWYAYLTNRSKL